MVGITIINKIIGGLLLLSSDQLWWSVSSPPWTAVAVFDRALHLDCWFQSDLPMHCLLIPKVFLFLAVQIAFSFNHHWFIFPSIQGDFSTAWASPRVSINPSVRMHDPGAFSETSAALWGGLCWEFPALSCVVWQETEMLMYQNLWGT